jgi:hypothetical protein
MALLADIRGLLDSIHLLANAPAGSGESDEAERPVGFSRSHVALKSPAGGARFVMAEFANEKISYRS